MLNRQAIVIGVNDYKMDSGLNSLKYAEKDAIILSAILSNQFGYEVILLTGENATREKIMNEFVKVSRIKDGEKFLFFFAGHGQSLGGEYYLHPMNAKIDNDIYSLRVNRLLDYFEKELSHKEVIGIIDSCHREMSLVERGATQLDQTATKDLNRRIQQEQNIQNKLVKVLFSCGIKQASYEDDRLGHGVFSHFLIKNMRENAQSYSFDNIAKDMGEIVPDYVKRHFGSKQSPVLFTPLTKKETWFGDENTNNQYRANNQKQSPNFSTTLLSEKELLESGMLEEFIELNQGQTKGSKWFRFYDEIKGKFEISDQSHLRELIRCKQIGPKENKIEIEEENKSDEKNVNTVTRSFTEDISNTIVVIAEEKKRIEKKLGIELITIRSGEFFMGSSSGNLSSQPEHKVILSSFLIGKYPITFDQFDAYCYEIKKEKKSDSGWGRGKLPVINISWDEANNFCNWLSEKTGERYRLPTEAEWEYAARGGKKMKGKLFSGDNSIDKVGWHKGNSGKRTSPVGQMFCNELGIYDMSGNVCEWCSDWFDEEYYVKSELENPKGPENGYEKVVRGGSANFNSHLCEVRTRYKYYPKIGNYNTGFRIVKDI